MMLEMFEYYGNKMKRRIFIVPFILLLVVACASQPRITVEALPGYDAAFARQSGWTGGDGAYSIALADEKILWLFGDTWVGEVQDGRHVHAELINNSIGIQSGRCVSQAMIHFVYRQTDNGKASAFIRPDDRQGWLWPYHGALDREGLFLFLVQIARLQGGPIASYAVTGNWLARIDNPEDSPRHWHIDQQKIPWSQFSVSGDTIFGSTVLKYKGFDYIFGTTEDIEDGFHHKYMIVARVPSGRLAEFSQWRFFSNGTWSADVSKAARLCENMANEYSVSYLESLGKYIVVYSGQGASETISARLAPEPHGPWSEPIDLFHCPEEGWDAKIFCYAAKAHPNLASAPDELIITYVTNSNDFDLIKNDARLYRPRFIRVRLND